MRSVLLEFEQELSALNDFMASAEAEESLLTMLSGQRERDHYGVQQAVQEIQKNLTN